MNSLFNTLGNKGPMQMLQQIKQNPAAILSRAGMSIPQGMTDPGQIVQHLVQSGQVPQARYNQVMQMVNQMKR